MIRIDAPDLGPVEDAFNFGTTESDNPLMRWNQEYSFRELKAPRPTVAQDGTFRGESWPKAEPQYGPRKSDGVIVPIWGGVPHAVFGGRADGSGLRSQLGVVTRAGPGGIRLKRTLTKAQHRAGFGAIKKGQVFSQENVLGRLRSDGSRYQSGDKQLGSLITEWAVTDPILSDDNKTLTKTSVREGAARIHDKRPFAFGDKIGPVEEQHLFDVVSEHFGRVL